MKWLRDNWTEFIIFFLIAGFLWAFIKKDQLSEEYLKMKARAESAETRAEEIQRESRLRIAALEKEMDEEKEKRMISERRVREIIEEKERIRRNYLREREKVREMEDDALAAAINARIGENQVKLLRMGIFSLQRVGAESALKLFIRGEECIEMREKDKKEMEELRAQIISLYNENSLLIESSSEKDRIIAARERAYSDLKRSTIRLEREFKSARLREFLKGAAVGCGIILILRLLSGAVVK